MQVILTSLAAVALAFVFDRLSVPAGAMLGAMLGIGVSRIAGWEVLEAPGVVKFAAFLVVGWLLGQSFQVDTLNQLRAAARPVTIVLVTLLVLTAALVWILSAFSELDPMTALLSSAPGGLVHIGAISADAGANTGVVVMVHLARLVSVVVMVPIITRLMSS